jgi:hypothetical protein
MKANRTQIAEILGVSLPTVDRWVAAGMPAETRGKKGIPSAFDVGVCVAWVRRRDAERQARRTLPQTRKNEPRASREDLRKILRGLWLPMEYMLPWHPGTPEVLGLREYEDELGLDHGSAELLDWLCLGLPSVAPAPGEKLLRIPLRQAELWRLLFGGLIEHCGGDGQALELGCEMRKLCGMPLGDGNATAASA